MTLSAGARFGPYEIADEIGAGGMGVVYRATDTKLKRDVAVKVLPESLATDEERLTRFQREAELLASLNHPNIAQIHGLEDADGAMALVMELVEGPTLEDRIKQDALPPDEALGIAMQIAEALECAHGQGIVHRDLKPANIKLRPDGVVKVLDFGIAKALELDALTSEPQSPMMTTPATRVGVILGTAAYMSPEQARGKQVDQRADIWAFGCVLYEMLTGQPAFGGEDVTVTLARVVERNADYDSLPGAITPAVRQTIELCLKKDLKERVADIRDVRLALAGAFEIVAPGAVDAAVAALPLWRRPLPVAAAALVAGAVLAIFAVQFGAQPEPQPVTRLIIDHPEGGSLAGNAFDSSIAISPDGRQVAYVVDAITGGYGRLYVRNLDNLDATPLADNARSPVFSPDGERVSFIDPTRSQLNVVSRTGGPVIPLADLSTQGPRGLTWGPDGTMIFADNVLAVGLRLTTEASDEIETISDPDPTTGELDHLFPEILPDGRSVLFTITNNQGLETSQIALLDLETGESRILIPGGSHAKYAHSGHIVFGAGWLVAGRCFRPRQSRGSRDTRPRPGRSRVDADRRDEFQHLGSRDASLHCGRSHERCTKYSRLGRPRRARRGS